MTDHLGVNLPAPQFALLTGDPQRVPTIARMAGGGSELTQQRGFPIFESQVDGIPFWTVATGIGGPSTAIVAEELIGLGVRCLIRVGTCGGIQPDVRPHDLILPTAAVRDEGTSRQYIDETFPAVAHHLVLKSLLSAADRLSLHVRVGLVHSKDAYYTEKPSYQLDPAEGRRRWEIWRAAGVLVTDMECATLFVVGALRKAYTGAVLVNVGKDPDQEAFNESLGNAISIIRETIMDLAAPGVIAPPSACPFANKESYLDRPTSTPNSRKLE